MSSDKEAVGTSIAEVLEGGLPQLLLGPAGKAISRLVGAAVEIPAGWLDEVAQASKDRKEARSKVMTAIGEKVAELAIANPDLLDRGLNTLLSKTLREQKNREAVADKAFEQLEAVPPLQGSDGPSDDWMNVFEGHAANASSEMMRDMFGRILAGEIRSPGTFSLQTVQLLSVLDAVSVRVISKIAPIVVDASAIPRDLARKRMEYEELLTLEEVGFLKIGAEMISFSKGLDPEGRCYFMGTQNALVVGFENRSGGRLDIGGYPLTRAGRELFEAIPVDTDFQALADSFWDMGAKSVHLGARHFQQGGQEYIAGLKELPKSASAEAGSTSSGA